MVRGSFAWPGQHLGQSLLGLLAGEPDRGLPIADTIGAPSTVLVYVCITLVEAAIAFIAALGFAWWWRTAGPAAEFGLAGRLEVEAVLGRRALRSRRKTIRPDTVVSLTSHRVRWVGHE
jgi:hypothetical protein